MAQRLSRKICPHCSVKQNISEVAGSDYSKFYMYAKDSLTHMDAKKLEDELKLRAISAEQWTDFSNGLMYS
jgi:type II secretory ATPase GspE/PulE/Tfp pilus assembly ATPase PilB-like protein